MLRSINISEERFPHMVLKTDLIPETNDVERFYDALAPDYDTMTGFEQRFVRERPFFHVLVERYQIHSALDAGCGTGFHSLLLAQLGVNVTAVDLAPKMIASARKRAASLGLSLKTMTSSFENLPQSLNATFDAVFSLGNSLAHSPSKEALTETLRSFARILRPGGLIFLQNLNYNRILADREKVQSVKEAGTKTFVRYYDYEGNDVVFNILTIEKTPDGIRENHRSIKIHPLLRQDMSAALGAAGFVKIQEFGGIAMNKYVELASKDLVVLAQLG